MGCGHDLALTFTDIHHCQTTTGRIKEPPEPPDPTRHEACEPCIPFSRKSRFNHGRFHCCTVVSTWQCHAKPFRRRRLATA